MIQGAPVIAANVVGAAIVVTTTKIAEGGVHCPHANADGVGVGRNGGDGRDGFVCSRLCYSARYISVATPNPKFPSREDGAMISFPFHYALTTERTAN
jgi:hypothetical protein